MGNAPGQDEQDGGAARSRLLYRYASLGFELAAAVAGLTLAGVWVDYHFEIAPVGTLVGAGLGIIGGLYNFVRAAIRLGQESAALGRRRKMDGGAPGRARRDYPDGGEPPE